MFQNLQKQFVSHPAIIFCSSIFTGTMFIYQMLKFGKIEHSSQYIAIQGYIASYQLYGDPLYVCLEMILSEKQSHTENGH